MIQAPSPRSRLPSLEGLAHFPTRSPGWDAESGQAGTPRRAQSRLPAPCFPPWSERRSPRRSAVPAAERAPTERLCPLGQPDARCRPGSGVVVSLRCPDQSRKDLSLGAVWRHAYSMAPPGREVESPLESPITLPPLVAELRSGGPSWPLKRRGAEGPPVALGSAAAPAPGDRPRLHEPEGCSRRALPAGEVSLEDCRSGVAAAAPPFHLASEFQLSSSSKHT